MLILTFFFDLIFILMNVVINYYKIGVPNYLRTVVYTLSQLDYSARIRNCQDEMKEIRTKIN